MALLQALVAEVLRRAGKYVGERLGLQQAIARGLREVADKIKGSKLGAPVAAWFEKNFEQIRKRLEERQEQRKQVEQGQSSRLSELQQAGAARRTQSYQDLDAYQRNNEQLRDQARQDGENRRAGGYQAKVTEAVGERGAAQYMQRSEPDFVMDRGFQPGTGFDQVYTKYDATGSPTEMRIIEAKGPGATLSTNAAKGPQMSQQWTENTVAEMMRSSDSETRALGQRLNDAIQDGYPPVTGQVLQTNSNGVTSVVPGTNGSLYTYN